MSEDTPQSVLDRLETLTRDVLGQLTASTRTSTHLLKASVHLVKFTETIADLRDIVRELRDEKRRENDLEEGRRALEREKVRETHQTARTALGAGGAGTVIGGALVYYLLGGNAEDAKVRILDKATDAAQEAGDALDGHP